MAIFGGTDTLNAKRARRRHSGLRGSLSLSRASAAPEAGALLWHDSLWRETEDPRTRLPVIPKAHESNAHSMRHGTAGPFRERNSCNKRTAVLSQRRDPKEIKEERQRAEKALANPRKTVCGEAAEKLLPREAGKEEGRKCRAASEAAEC